MTNPVRCPLCDCSNAKFLFQERGYRVMACDECDLLYINPYPGQQEAHDKVADYSYEDLKIVDVDRHYRSSILYYQTYFPKLVREIAGVKRILDVGCGTGRLLELARELNGVERVGIELNKRRAAHARQVAQCEVHETPIEEFSVPQPFDAIFLMNVFSHVHIDTFFPAIHRLLADDGKVILKVGEMTRGVKKHALNDWGVPDHLHFLGMRTSEILARKYGMRIAGHERLPHSHEQFAPSTWKAPGRNVARNLIKRSFVAVPFALPMLSKVYDWFHGSTIFTSLIVMKKDS